MQIKLHWHEPIELGSSGTLRQTFKNFDFKTIPNVAGIYIFYRQTLQIMTPTSIPDIL